MITTWPVVSACRLTADADAVQVEVGVLGGGPNGSSLSTPRSPVATPHYTFSILGLSATRSFEVAVA